MESKNIIGLLKTDKNGVEMKAGNIVEIKNAYFKNDNGVYFVDNAPGDASWCGSGYSLKKMRKNGKLSTATHNIAFWPLCAFTSNRQKNAECKAWNEQNATIEVVYNIDNAQVVEHFKQKAEALEKQITRQGWDFGEGSEIFIKSTELKKHYLSVVERLSKIEAPDQVQEPEKANQSRK